MKTILVIVLMVIIGSLVVIGGRSFKAANKSQIKPRLSIARRTSDASINKTNSVQTLPQPPLTCSTNANLIPFTQDYTITGMDCVSAGTANVVLVCNGTILQGGTNVTVDCSAPAGPITGNGVVCNGNANSSNSPGNLSLNYTCYNSSQLSNQSVYACSGDIVGYSSLGINLPLNVNCGF